MARGKHRAIAQRRVEAVKEIGSIETLKRQYAELQKNYSTLKEQYEKALETHRNQVSSLQVMIEENTSSQVKELNKSIALLLNEKQSMEKEVKKIKDLWGDAIINLCEYIKITENTTHSAAYEKSYHIIKADDSVVLDDKGYASFLSKKGVSEEELSERVKTLQRIRGIR